MSDAPGESNAGTAGGGIISVLSPASSSVPAEPAPVPAQGDEHDDHHEMVHEPVEPWNDVEGVEPWDLDKVAFDDKKHAAQTSRLIALRLVWILAGTAAAHYLAVFLVFICLSKPTDAAKILESAFNTLIPVISGLASSAVTFYFTKNRNQ